MKRFIKDVGFDSLGVVKTRINFKPLSQVIEVYLTNDLTEENKHQVSNLSTAGYCKYDYDSSLMISHLVGNMLTTLFQNKINEYKK